MCVDSLTERRPTRQNIRNRICALRDIVALNGRTMAPAQTLTSQPVAAAASAASIWSRTAMSA